MELTFREQYLGRSEMWRIKSQLVGSVVFLNKKADLCGGVVRCQVQEMWAKGERLSCGVVTEETKIVFRSPTAMVYLFIQMSAEMWGDDENGNQYYEKAIDGFLAEMFEKWRDSGSSHEVTIVLFSRCYYHEATSLDEFPPKMRQCLQTAADGAIYEDFYRVVVQNERFEDWAPTLLELRQLIIEYAERVEGYHQHQQQVMADEGACALHRPIPKARISTAEKGNFLEVLNISLNTFENHFLNRNMERTGQQSIVITPGLLKWKFLAIFRQLYLSISLAGVGVFEVDRELTQITKQRIIDSGVGSDLICLGQQPLHAVPLLKFAQCDKDEGEFSMPHWINLSYYAGVSLVTGQRPPPRIRVVELPPEQQREQQGREKRQPNLILDKNWVQVSWKLH